MRKIHKAGEAYFVVICGLTVPVINASTDEIHQAQIFVDVLRTAEAYDSVAQTRQDIPDWMNFYSQDRRNANLGRLSPDQIHYDLPSGFLLET